MTRFGRRAKFRHCSSGAAAAEFAIICLVLIVFSVGIVEIGRGLYLRNQLLHAVDVAARQIITNLNASDVELESAIRTRFSAGTPDALQVTLGVETLDGITFRTIKINYPLDLMIPALNLETIPVTVARRMPAG